MTRVNGASPFSNFRYPIQYWHSRQWKPGAICGSLDAQNPFVKQVRVLTSDGTFCDIELWKVREMQMPNQMVLDL